MKGKNRIEIEGLPKNSLARDTWRRLLSNKAAVFGSIIMILIILMAIFADVLYDYETQVIAMDIPNSLKAPCAEYPLGTDEFGRDILARIVHGSRMSLIISFTSVAISLVIGGICGALSGYFGGRIDNLIMRITDILLAIPMTLFAIVIVAALGPSTKNLAIALAASSIPVFARIVRSAVLTVRDVEYIEAARERSARQTVPSFWGTFCRTASAPSSYRSRCVLQMRSTIRRLCLSLAWACRRRIPSGAVCFLRDAPLSATTATSLSFPDLSSC